MQINTKIKQLSDVTISRIAAGEVIERPSSVIKELVENAIDAGATKIDIVLETAGKNLIIVSDNGSGMTRDDLELSVQRHTTSKLQEDDIMDIKSFGFRGEALPSIGSISKLAITTYDNILGEGYQIAVEGGEVKAISSVLCNLGTKVEVRDLFFATPARLKFLRSDRTELNACIDVIKKIAMSSSNVTFSLLHDGKSIIKLRASSLVDRVNEILGQEFIQNAAEVCVNRDDIAITGFVSLPTFHRATAEDQYLFVNGRSVKDKLIHTAVRVAYQDFIVSGRYPVVALFIEMNPKLVDVNVHPAKAEVRFHDTSMIRGLVISAIRDALSKVSHKVSTTNAIQAMQYFIKEDTSVLNTIASDITSNYRPNIHHARPLYNSNTSSPNLRIVESYSSMPEEILPNMDKKTYYPLGGAAAQFKTTYIISQTEDSIVITDQHAAHERITYETLKLQMSNNKVIRQRLLIPEIIKLPDRKRMDAIHDNKSYLAECGLIFDVFDEDSIIVNEVPAILENANITNLMNDIADNLVSFGEEISLAKLVEHITETYACHHSIRAGRVMNISEMNALLRQIENTPFSGQCNHGRPTYIELKLKDIEKLFGRK